MCFFKVFLTALQSLCSIHAIALCSWVPLGGTWEYKALAWVGYKLWRRDNNLPCGVYYSKFLDFFPVWGEHSVNHGWLCTGEDVRQVCGHRSLFVPKHHGFSARVDSTEIVRAGIFNCNKAAKWISGTTLSIHSSHTQCVQGSSIATKLQNESQVQLWHYLGGVHSCAKPVVLWCKSCLCPHTWHTPFLVQSHPWFTECSPQTVKKSRNLQ